MKICQADIRHSSQIAKLIMQAMNYDCCRFFMGEGHELEEFQSAMTALVTDENTQYSYRNTLVATDEAGLLLGICVSYDGACLHDLRKAFVCMMKERFGRDFSNMSDETQVGELYIDSLAVDPRYRGQGIATCLLEATKSKAADMGLPAVGLLVDEGNPDAERLYARQGFVFVGTNTWGGHPMRHLQYILENQHKQ
ncbi:MAG: GNAT family N-acetyltransferase [Prevotella sp.]